MKSLIVFGIILSVSSFANADIRVDGNYQGVVQSRGFGKASCAVNLKKTAASYVLKFSICSDSSTSCMDVKFLAQSKKSALATVNLDRALVSTRSAERGSRIFKSQGYAHGGEETLVGRLNSQGDLVQILYTTGTGLYPVYVV